MVYLYVERDKIMFTPDKKFVDRQNNSIRPSWEANPEYVNTEHQEIFNQTKDLPGWQMEGDTYKLYEMGYFAGDVILEIGTFGGRSAVVELRGALSNENRPTTQFFGIEVDINGIWRTYHTLEQEKLAEHALLYHGTLQEFIGDFYIKPTMVFVDGDHRYEGVKRDLNTLSELLTPGVPVLCHDYLNPENDTGAYGVRQAATEWESAGFAQFIGVFGCSALFITTENCEGMRQGLSLPKFEQYRTELLQDYGIIPNTSVLAETHKLQSPTAKHNTTALYQELQRVYNSKSYRLGYALLQPLRIIKKKFNWLNIFRPVQKS